MYFQVKCSPVYVTEDEKAKHVTKTVIAQSTVPEDKKKRSSKYSVAVGSSFGHGKQYPYFPRFGTEQCRTSSDCSFKMSSLMKTTLSRAV